MEKVEPGAGPEAVAEVMGRQLAEVTAAFTAHLKALYQTLEQLQGRSAAPNAYVPNRADRRRAKRRYREPNQAVVTPR